MAQVRNNVTRMLDQRGIPYEVFVLPPEKLGALEVAERLGVPPGQVFKTIVVLREGRGKPILAVVPGDREVDLKALARAVGEKRLRLPTEREAERLTGLKAGGISPLALLGKRFQVVVDEAIRDWEAVHLSGGQRGVNLRLPVAAVLELLQPLVAPVTRPLSGIKNP